MQETRVPSLVWEDPICLKAANCMPQLLSPHSGALKLQLLKPIHLEPTLRSKRSNCNGKLAHLNED